MTPRERFIAALEHRPIPGRVPNFELVFYLTMEAFGKVHPSHRHYAQWDQMTEKERELHREDMARVFIDTANRYEHNAIYLHVNPGRLDETYRIIDKIRTISGDQFCLLAPGDATFGIPNGENMIEWCGWLHEHPDEAKNRAKSMVENALKRAEHLKAHGELDGFCLCADYCFNTGPFMSPAMFAEFVTPYLADLIAGYREMGFYTIKHTDGNIIPIIDQLVSCNPHALHSLDPQGGIDIAVVKKLYGDKVALIGNVNCGLIDTGTDEEVIESVRYALRYGMPGGYIFATSNCVYTGMRLERYDLVLDVWRKEGNYDTTGLQQQQTAAS